MEARRFTIIESIGVYLPEQVVSTADLLRGCTRTVRFPLEEFTGIVTRRVAGESEFSIDIARRAISNCLARSSRGPEAIDLLIACNICRLDGPNRVALEPGTAQRMRSEFGFHRALAFDIANACAGMFTGVWIADALIRAQVIQRALIFSGEYITHLSRTAQKEIDGYMDPRLACLTVGDAGAAVVLEPAAAEGCGFHAIDIFTLARYSSVCVAKPSDRSHGGATMLTDPMQAASLGIEPSADHAAALLRASGFGLDEIRHIIPHQISTISITEGVNEIGKRFRIDLRDRVINNLADRGNTASNTHFVAIHDRMLDGRIRSGDAVLFGIAGSGISVGSAVYKFDDLPERLRKPRSTNSRPQTETGSHDERPVVFDHRGLNRVRIESIGLSRIENTPDEDATRRLEAKAAEECLRRSGKEARDVELLLGAGLFRSGFVVEPAAAALVADDLRMNSDHDRQDARRTFAFDLVNGALGCLNACHMASELIRTGVRRNALVVAAECRLPQAGGGQVDPQVSEVGSAMLLSRSLDPSVGFRRFVFRYFPEYTDSIQSYVAQANGQTHLARRQSAHAEHYLLNSIRATADELLAIEACDWSHIRHVVLPQISSQFIGRAARVLGVETAKCVDVTDDADLHTSSIAFALARIVDEGLVEPGDVLMLIGAGSGIQVGCALYDFG